MYKYLEITGSEGFHCVTMEIKQRVRVEVVDRVMVSRVSTL